MTALIGIDWGTTSFRAWRMGAGGEVLETVGQGPGILAAGALPGGFAQALNLFGFGKGFFEIGYA